MRILVTGSTGFIGSHLVERLKKDGHEIVGLGRTPSDQDIEFIQGDVRDKETVKKACKDVDLIFHLATQKVIADQVKGALENAQWTVCGTINLLQEAPCDFVYISSAAAYGEPLSVPIPEDAPLNPFTSYGASHAATEHYVRAISRFKGKNYTIFRLFNVYGYDRKLTNVVCKFIEKIKANQDLVIHGDGSQVRDYVHVTDVANALALSIKNKNAENNVFNVGSGQGIAIKELASDLIELSGKNLKIQYVESRAQEKATIADISKAKKLLNWTPTMVMREGLADMLRRQ